jgi:predicted peptidase
MPAEIAIAALDQTLAEFRVDSDRVYLTGLSMGANGTWYLAYRYPQRFAAVVPICGNVTALPASRIMRSVVPTDSGEAFAALARRLGRLPTWIFHGEADPVVPVEESRQASEALRLAGGDVRYTEFLGLGHNVWDAVYASREFREWLFGQRRRR